MSRTPLWIALSLVVDFFGSASSFKVNGSDPVSVPRIHSKYRQDVPKNNSEFRKVRHTAENLTRTSLNNILSVQVHLTDDETFDGFEFVDSPEIGSEISDSTDRTGGTEEPIDSSGSGSIEQNSWRTYPNGTIIHDVRISLVHPANVAGIVDKSYSSGSAPFRSVDSAHTKLETNVTRDGRASQALKNQFVDASNATVLPFEAMSTGSDPSTAAVNRTEVNPAAAVTVPTVNSSADIANVTAGLIAARSSGKLPSTNLGDSIKSNEGPCFSECMTKCSTLETNSPVSPPATCLPSCLPKTGSHASPDDPGSSTISNPFPPIGQKEGISENATSPGPEVARELEIGRLKDKESTEPKLGFLLEDICLSESCVLKAADIMRKLGKSADPCNSFYGFACGGYLKNEIPDGESSRSAFSDISSDILSRMFAVLKSPLLATDQLPVKLLKKFYGKCVLTSPKQLFMDALEELGGWPSPHTPTQRVPQQIWGSIAFNWTYGMFLEYNLLSINLTFASVEGEWTLNVDYPWFVKVALNSESFSVLEEMERDIRVVASALGIDNSTTRTVLGDLRIFMASAIKYAKATASNAERGFSTLADLRARFIHLDVLKKLPYLLETAVDIGDNETIYVTNMKYLQKVDELLRDTTVRTQECHLVLTALRTLLVLIGTATDNVREKYCVKLTGKLFPHLFGHLYSSSYVSNSKVASATRIASQIQSSLLSMLDQNLNDTTKEEITDKINNLTFVWGHRDAVNDDLYGIARGFDENPSFFSFVKTGIWNLKKVTYGYLHQRVNTTLGSFIERYSEDDYGVNAFYYSQHILIPYSALHENIFDPDVPPYISYGGLGVIVGHELLHSVIAAGDLSDSVLYKNVEKCIINQMNEFTKKRFHGRVDGVLTKDENLADHGGFKVAYRAFLEAYDSSPRDSRLPGLHKFNGKQMFWLTAATNWCQKVSPDSTSSSADKHAPPEFRVDGQFANLPEFAEDFNCPVNSPMNPKEKCSLW